jgi:hypothetical protein
MQMIPLLPLQSTVPFSEKRKVDNGKRFFDEKISADF